MAWGLTSHKPEHPDTPANLMQGDTLKMLNIAVSTS